MIALVVGRCAVAQLDNGVVGALCVAMIEVVGRPVAMRKRPNHAVNGRIVFYSVDREGDLQMTETVIVSGLLTCESLVPSYNSIMVDSAPAPEQQAALRITAE